MTAFDQKVLSATSGTGVGTNSGVTVTVSAPGASRALHCTGIECSGDAAAVVTVESPSGTKLYQKRFAGAFTLTENWDPGEKVGATNGAMLVKISASTSNCEANISTVTLPG